MSEVPFYQTRMGRQFYEVTMPELVRQLTRLNDMFALYVELIEKQVEQGRQSPSSKESTS